MPREDNIQLSEITFQEFQQLIEENEFHIMEVGRNKERTLEDTCRIMIHFTNALINSGILIKLIPGSLRIVANAIDVITQNVDRERKKK